MTQQKLKQAAYVTLIIGGVNWGLLGLLQLDLIALLFGVDTPLSILLYLVIGAAAVYTATVELYVPLVRRVGNFWRTARSAA